ncbi:30S ribosomal protein S18 [Mycobacterium sp. NPDC050441]|uniref:30S ribosomal protein S18 n=1 Tax=Mycobacterium sp. NPDC050441 TaxID=3155403 RepID=UPI0033D14537
MATNSRKNNKKRPPAPDLKKPRRNQLDVLGVTEVDYKDVHLLRTFISERGKIRSRRITGLTPQQQRQVATAIKNAREMALLPVVGPA